MKIDRMISIIMLLLEHDKVSASKLAQMHEVSVRTIYRDLEAINQAGIPIVTTTGVNGGAGIMENYKLEKRLFSTTDVAALLMSLSGVKTTLSNQDITGALAKVEGLIPENMRKEIEMRAGQVTIDMSPWMGNAPFHKHFELIKTAMDNKRLICFSYSDRDLKKTVRKVEPYRIVFKETSWYMDGFCLSREDFRLFKLSRMSDVKMMAQEFEYREYSRKGTVTASYPGDKDILKAVFRVDEKGRDHFLDFFSEDLFVEEKREDRKEVLPEKDCSGMVEGEGKRWIVKTRIPNNEMGYRYVLAAGTGCECLEPERFRDGMKNYIKRILAAYE